MPDIFGREPEDYELVQDLQDEKIWDRYQRANAIQRPWAAPTHDFNSLGAWGNGQVPQQFARASEDQQAIGYITNNLLALQTVADNILYTAYRLPQFLHLNTSVPEGARTYGVRIRNRVGQAQRITAPGFEAPSATASETIITQDMHWYGLDAEWSLDELRGAMFGGHPLDTESIDAAVTGTMETMEAVGLTGGNYAEKGLLNLGYDAATEDDANMRVMRSMTSAFAMATPEDIRRLICDTISKIIENTKETFGRNVNTGCTVYLPGTAYDVLTSRYIGDNSERTLMRALMEDNPWTHFTKNPLAIERVLELDGIAPSDAGRMVIALKHQRVAEMGISIMPRVLRIMDKGRVICAQVEAKFSPTFVKRADTIYYVDGVS